jgi:hypothetical protein
MSNQCNVQSAERQPGWLPFMRPFISAALSVGAFGYVGVRYTDLTAQPGGFPWVQAVPLAVMTLAGVLAAVATFLLIAGQASGRSVLRYALSLIPAVLFLNLLLLLGRLVKGGWNYAFQALNGNPPPWPDFQLSPRNLIVQIIVILVVVGLAWAKAAANRRTRPSEDQ